KDHEVHLQAQVRVFEQLLAQWPRSHARMKRLVEIERGYAHARLRAARLMSSAHPLTARAGNVLFTLLRIKIALRRRSPAYPKPNFVDAGPPTAFAVEELAVAASPPTAAR
ncbi:MAG TPA: hypothetical protein VHF69_14625, partial [Candidatus Synoicihabitans sp.]|nr:hypothetical protein [Candidatus Synoicihabitans sp.]